jgi:predicted ATP-dependent protease
LCGKVTAIGGLEAKLNGAIKAGCTLCCIPKENEEDLRLIIKKDKEEKAKMVRSESMKNFDLSPVTENESFDFVSKENQVIYKGLLTVCIVDNIIDFIKVALVENDIQWNSHFITKHEE